MHVAVAGRLWTVIIDKPIRSIDSFHPAIAKTIYLHFIGFNVFKPKNSSLTLLLSLAALALTVRTGAQVVTINQGFTGTTAPGWNLGGTGYTPVLTAAQGIDPSGSGWLRLTSNGGNQATYAYDTTSFNAANATIAVKFNYATYNGSGADGLTFFAPVTYYWAEGSQHTVGAPGAQRDQVGSLWAFGSWSDGGAQYHTYTVAAGGGPHADGDICPRSAGGGDLQSTGVETDRGRKRLDASDFHLGRGLATHHLGAGDAD